MRTRYGSIPGLLGSVVLLAGIAGVCLAQGAAGESIVDDWASMTDEEKDAYYDRVAAARLANERDAVATEIREDLLYDAAAKDKAAEILGTDPEDTQADNIDRICRAFAAVDAEFAEAYAPYEAGEPEKALEVLGEVLDVRQTSYRSAALHYLAGECLQELERYDEAVERYGVILAVMRDRISFASMAAVRGAEAREAEGRFYHALRMYMYCLREYDLTLSTEEYNRIYKRAKYLADIYADPANALAERMEEVKQRLAETDSGEATREKQDEIAAVLIDLIKFAEENSGGGGGSSPQQNQAQKGGDNEGRKPGAGRPKPAGPRGTPSRPSGPAEASGLPPGIAERPGELDPAAPGDTASEDWNRLPKEERDRIEAAMRKLHPEKYRRRIEAYRKAMASEDEEDVD